MSFEKFCFYKNLKRPFKVVMRHSKMMGHNLLATNNLTFTNTDILAGKVKNFDNFVFTFNTFNRVILLVSTTKISY